MHQHLLRANRIRYDPRCQTATIVNRKLDAIQQNFKVGHNGMQFHTIQSPKSHIDISTDGNKHLVQSTESHIALIPTEGN